MNLFLLTYDRKRRSVLDLQTFGAGEFERANRALLQAELAAGADTEVVLLEADSKDQLRKTHRRYFDDSGARLIAAS